MTATTSRFPDGLPDLPAGVYRHHKGGLYQVLGYAQDSTNGLDEPRAVVVYVGLQLPGTQVPGEATSMRMKVREAQEFHDFVHGDGEACDYQGWSRNWPPSWCDEHDTGMSLRFRYLDVEVPRADH